MSTTKKAHFQPENFNLANPFARLWCGWKRSRGGQSGVITDAYVTTDKAQVTCTMCLMKLEARTAPKAAKPAKPARAKRERACEICSGSGRYLSAGRWTIDGIVAVGESCDFCAMCQGRGTVVR